MWSRWMAVVLVGALSFDADATEKEIAWDKLYGLGDVSYQQIDATKRDGSPQRYHVFVRMPNNPQDGERYPVVYLLDGGANFPLFASYYHYLHFMEDVPSMIVVGISYGTQNWRLGNNRSTDYTAPAEGQDHWGGAAHFEAFLIDNLMPTIAKNYPVDPDQQILFGQSLGGQFALYTSMYGKAPFHAVIATNPALHRNLAFFQQPLKKRSDRPKTFIAAAELDDERFRLPLLEWQKHWQGKNPEWERKFHALPGHNHLSANPVAFRDAMKWIRATTSVEAKGERGQGSNQGE